MSDYISRQAAIDAFDGVKVDEENCTEYDIGYNDGIDFTVSKLSALPSADVPDVIHCQECKYAQVADLNDEQDGYTCQFHRGSIWFSGCYCSWGERKTE